MNRLYEFVEQMCKEYNIDESHDLRHAKDCVETAYSILDYNITEDEKEVITYAAALHDCVDKKYTNVSEATEKVRTFLISEGWTNERAQAVLNIINTMSYSHLNKQMIDGAIVFPEHGVYQKAYHIIRQADLLCSYKVERCYLYQKHVAPTMPEDEVWKRVNALFQSRVFKYVSNGWLSLPKAQAFVPNLIKKAEKILESHELP